MKFFFNSEDLKRLEQIDESQLYCLNCMLLEASNEAKRLCMAEGRLIRDLVVLTEIAAKEIACRKRWSPIQYDGKYSNNGITYDTKEYRKWLWDNRHNVCDAAILNQFSFGYDILEFIGK